MQNQFSTFMQNALKEMGFTHASQQQGTASKKLTSSQREWHDACKAFMNGAPRPINERHHL